MDKPWHNAKGTDMGGGKNWNNIQQTGTRAGKLMKDVLIMATMQTYMMSWIKYIYKTCKMTKRVEQLQQLDNKGIEICVDVFIQTMHYS